MSAEYVMQWSDTFLTDIKEVDDQHFFLVELVNKLGGYLFQKNVSFSALKQILEHLLEYTEFHFSSEEKLMGEKRLYGPFVKEHRKNHRLFVLEVSTLYKDLKEDEQVFKKAKFLFDFLMHWLAFHILEQDQLMAQQVRLIDQGMEAKQAYEKVARDAHGPAEPLVQALNGLFGILSSRNHELIELKKSLEQKVEERTEELVLANQELERIAVTDPLTGVYNRRHAIACLERLWKNQGDSAVFSCILVDIDHFKVVNDKYGHDKGDEILVEVVKAMKDAVRTDDIVCRLGGDEFLILCPDTPLLGGIQVANKVLSGINGLQFLLDDCVRYEGRASLGVGSSEDKASYTHVLKEADRQAYKSKSAGRNCVRPVA